MKHSGYTLIELLVTLSVLAILTGFSMPGFAHIKKQIQADVLQQQWLEFLNTGRASAVQRDSIITLCPMEDNQCVNDFNETWVMFTDNNKNKSIDADELIVQTLTPNQDQRFKLYPQSRNFIRFYNESSGVYSGLMTSLTLCSTGKADEFASHIRINIMGRVSATQKRDAEGVPLRLDNQSWQRVSC